MTEGKPAIASRGARIHRHAAKGRFERVDRRRCYAAHMNIVRRTDEHDARDRVRTIAKRCKCGRGGRARIDIAGMRHDERFGNVFGGHCDVGEESPRPACADDPRYQDKTGLLLPMAGPPWFGSATSCPDIADRQLVLRIPKIGRLQRESTGSRQTGPLLASPGRWPNPVRRLPPVL